MEQIWRFWLCMAKGHVWTRPYPKMNIRVCSRCERVGWEV